MTGRWRSAVGVAVLAFLGTKLVSLVVNLVAFPTLRRRPGGSAAAAPDAAGRRPVVQVLVPMRDEALRLPATVEPLLDSGATRIAYLDDESTDGSAQVVTALVADRSDVDVQVISGVPRPDGWTGKTWACQQLAESALRTDADILLFLDADVRLAPGAVEGIVTEMERQQADVFSVFCRQLVAGWPQRLTVSLIDDVVLCFLPFPLLSVPVPAAATAFGGVLAFRREAYQKIGGFASVCTEVVEDVAIARRTRRLGLRLGLALGGEAVQVRLYDTFSSAITGLGRGLRPVAGGRRWLVVVGYLWHVVAYTLPLLWVGRSAVWTAAALMGILERMLLEAKTGGRDWPAAAAVSASPLVAVPIVAQALRSVQVWKGRSYS